MDTVKDAFNKLKDPKVRKAVMAAAVVVAVLILVYDLVIRPRL